MADADWAKYKQLRGYPLPETIPFAGATYELVRHFKRDFYAATGLYRLRAENPSSLRPEFLVHKVYHTDPLLILPLRWLGKRLCEREIYFHELTKDMNGVPRFYGRVGVAGFVREYIPGCHFREYRKTVRPSRELFVRLYEILAELHARGISHNDLAKPENILVRPDGTPVVIDMQIALSYRFRFPLLRAFAPRMRRYMQSVDRYHIMKLHRKSRPEDFLGEAFGGVQEKGFLLRLHGWLVRRPYRGVRHFIMNLFMKAKSTAADTESSRSTNEVPPAKAA